MATRYHLKETFAWLAASVVVMVAGFGLGAAGYFATGESSKVAALIFWLAAIPAVALSVKAMLVLTSELDSAGALKVAGLAVVLGVGSVLMHNLLYALIGTEEPFFFLLALWLAPVLFIAAIIRAFRPHGGSHGVAPPGAAHPT